MNPFRRGDHAETERLLDSVRADLDATSDRAGRGGDAASPQARVPASPGPSADRVAGLLAAAAGPARPGELAGEEAALAAFRAARADPAPSVPPRPHRRRLTTGAVAWIGAVAATATAGAAFAAVTRDRAPDPVAPQPSRTSPSPQGSAPPSGEPSRSAPPGPPPPGRPSSGPPSPGVPSAGTPPTPGAPAGDLDGLCRAWQAKKPEERERALRTPAFERLVAAAGGPAGVEAYCQRLGPERRPSEPAKPQPPSPPTGPLTRR
ncbi:hypothetical protein ACGFIW_15770 [Micromonospora sp. NPDC048935]|uniref:hypothetical protein n=1 Tax=Micromonospora sp. NPDC048935 TaxID=3364262 RepID=UPI0037122741